MAVIKRLGALEILDSRGRPTIQATCELSSDAVGTASVPSGASTGKAETHELRDGEPRRYYGLGCRKAVKFIQGEINSALTSKSVESQAELDQSLIKLDGTPNKSRLGGNTLLAVSIAFARACAMEKRIPLYKYFSEIIGPATCLPLLTVNLFSGGKHAGGQVPIQDVLLVPKAESMEESLELVFQVYQSASQIVYRKYGMRPLVADEGGLAPQFPDAETMIQDAVDSINAAGLKAGRDMFVAIDVASSSFYDDGRYRLGKEILTSEAMIERLLRWLDRFPIVSIEDGLAEDDWDNWPKLCERIGKKALCLGDDLLCTNPERIGRAIDTRSANALLLKVNQIGTLSESAEAYKLARSAGWNITISARSGETEDNWLADLAVGWSGDQIKIGSITRSERLSKYNRLIAIEAETNLPLSSLLLNLRDKDAG